MAVGSKWHRFAEAGGAEHWVSAQNEDFKYDLGLGPGRVRRGRACNQASPMVGTAVVGQDLYQYRGDGMSWGMGGGVVPGYQDPSR